MQLFNSKRALVLGMTLSALAFGVQGAQAQDAAATQDAPASATATDPAPAAATPAAPAVAQLNPIGAPEAGKGQIVFFRPSKYAGLAVSFSVREGNTGVIKLTNGTYGVLQVDPGIKEYNTSMEAKDTLRMEVDEGETYYVLQSLAMGLITYRPIMTPSSEAAFQAKKLKLTKATATDHSSN